MIHIGDISTVHTTEIPTVDCIIGGSPCQDLSIAGQRKGLTGERSGLFGEQIRVVREMRKASGCPRYMIWENVPGALSSNKGEDFRVVLEKICRIADETITIPQPPKNKWGVWIHHGRQLLSCMAYRGCPILRSAAASP